MLRKVFFLEHIYLRQTGIQLFIHISAILIIPFLLFGDGNVLDGELLHTVFVIPWFIYIFFVIRMIIRAIIVSVRMRKSRVNPLATPVFLQSADSAINQELDTVDEVRIIEQQEKLNLYDAIFNFYRHTKNGDYLARQAYYTVLELKLDRMLPHIIFDSRSAKRRQFRYRYIQSQRLSLEGNFAAHFDAYVPQTYHIDMMSFITPEVMEAILTAKDYDIEILDDRVMLYAPLTDMGDLERLKTIGLNIAAQLNDNIDNYRDDRLLGTARTREVTQFSRALLKSPMPYVPACVISGVITMGVITTAIISPKYHADEILFNDLSLYAYAFFVSTLWAILKINHDNHVKLRRFEQAAHYADAERSRAANRTSSVRSL